MIRQVLRTVGIGCLLAGGILYIVNTPQASNTSLEKELTAIQQELAAVKKELAISQTISSKNPNSKKFTNGREFIVAPGTASTDLSKQLEEEQFIDDAEKFDAYMEENDYTDKMESGTFMLYDGMRFPDIARVLLGL
ncbi:hypothetical protein DV702_04220 [Sporosarcina sp. PTS2304]|uniref:hypothetical protein n=1 Tax=Sporosarcina sp. PTS2304 TaxID=2283194 RepID=UPI000E0D2157|nr:hypothetical protein [Sporosarcina sp. PTS2304]AXH99006.1 hypothetical protein DV702_04220 [Sporosarcina sp. PTS2304]